VQVAAVGVEPLGDTVVPAVFLVFRLYVIETVLETHAPFFQCFPSAQPQDWFAVYSTVVPHDVHAEQLLVPVLVVQGVPVIALPEHLWYP
jgi:hypothetical protein